MTEEHEGDKQNEKEVPKDTPVFKSARRVSIAAAEIRNNGGSQNQSSAREPEEKVETQEK